MFDSSALLPKHNSSICVQLAWAHDQIHLEPLVHTCTMYIVHNRTFGIGKKEESTIETFIIFILFLYLMDTAAIPSYNGSTEKIKQYLSSEVLAAIVLRNSFVFTRTNGLHGTY